MPHHVFVSYSSKDKQVARAVCAALEANGVRCWMAPRDVMPGVNWSEAIIDAIASSRVMVLVFSQSANSSPQVQREVERAVSKDVHIVPFRIEAAKLSKTMEYFISAPHWLDAMAGPLEPHVQRLTVIVRKLIEGVDAADALAAGIAPADASPPPAPARVAPPRQVPKQVTSGPPQRTSTGCGWFLATLLLLLAAGAGGYAYLHGGLKQWLEPSAKLAGPTSMPSTASTLPSFKPFRFYHDLNRRSLSPRLTFPAHGALVTSLCASGEGRLLASASTESDVKIWNTTTGKLVTTIPAGGIAPYNTYVFLARDGKTVATATNKSTILWDVASKSQLLKLDSPATGNNYFLADSYNKRVLAVGRVDVVHFWDLSTRTDMGTLEPDPRRIFGGAISADATQVAIGRESMIELWDVATRRKTKVVTTFKPLNRTNPLSDLGFTPDGKMLFARVNGLDQIWDLNSDQNYGLEHKVPMAISRDGRLLACGEVVWNMATGTPFAEVQIGNMHNISSVTFLGNTRTLAIGTSLGGIFLTEIPDPDSAH